MARQGPGMTRLAAVFAACRRRSGAAGARRRVLVALVFAVGVADRTAAQMSADAWSTDAAMNASATEQSARAKSGPDFPPTTYAALGFSLVHTWHFAGLGWSQEQIAAF